MSTVKERKAAGSRRSLTVSDRPGRTDRRTPATDRRSAEVAEWARKAGLLPEVRAALVERVRAEIEAGVYETPEKLEAAVDEMLKDLADT